MSEGEGSERLFDVIQKAGDGDLTVTDRIDLAFGRALLSLFVFL